MMSQKVTLGKPHVKHFMKQVPASTSAPTSTSPSTSTCASTSASSFTYLALPWPHPGSRSSLSPPWCAAASCWPLYSCAHPHHTKPAASTCCARERGERG
jgi:hypothetical protein